MENNEHLDLISRKALIAEYDRVHIGPPGGARKLMEDAPGVDAVEVVHGHWGTDRFGLDRSICSVCGACYEGDGGNYCRNCGAKMDGGNEDV